MDTTTLLAAFSVIAVVVFAQPIDDCDVGPAYWCVNAQTARECQAVEYCQLVQAAKTQKNGTDPEKGMAYPAVEVSLYYEALCGGCRQLLMSQYFPTYEKLKGTGVLNINLYPYGNAYEYWDGYKWRFQCQHGSGECVVNTVESCALNVLSSTQKIPFVRCMESSPYVQNVQACAGRVGADYNRLYKCYTGTEGNNLEHQVALKTAALNPRHQYVPWVTVNGVHSSDIQNRISYNMLAYVCSAYTGPKPSACSGAIEKEEFKAVDHSLDGCYRT